MADDSDSEAGPAVRSGRHRIRLLVYIFVLLVIAQVVQVANVLSLAQGNGWLYVSIAITSALLVSTVYVGVVFWIVRSRAARRVRAVRALASVDAPVRSSGGTASAELVTSVFAGASLRDATSVLAQKGVSVGKIPLNATVCLAADARGLRVYAGSPRHPQTRLDIPRSSITRVHSDYLSTPRRPYPAAIVTVNAPQGEVAIPFLVSGTTAFGPGTRTAVRVDVLTRQLSRAILGVDASVRAPLHDQQPGLQT